MTGGGTGFTIVWPPANELCTAILEIAARTNVTITILKPGEAILPPG